MTFRELHLRLLEDLRRRVRSGAATERGLARETGLSQPHLHHVLKGKRVLSFQKADEVLRRLDLDVLHLIRPEELQEFNSRR
jgi:hypothetical protein